MSTNLTTLMLNFDVKYWAKKYEEDYREEANSIKYKDKNGKWQDEKSPYFETISKVLRARGYLYKKEFVNIGIWKTSRQVKNYRANAPEKVKRITEKVLKEKDASKQINLLTKDGEGLKGVKIAVASAILTVVNPEEFCIIDYRVWRALKWLQKTSDSGQLTFDSYTSYSRYIDGLDNHEGVDNYLDYLKTLRYWGGQKNVCCLRELEMALWKFDKLDGQK